MLERSQKSDLNPPLEPTLVRLSCRLFGAHEFGARLPSIVAFTIFLCALFLTLLHEVPLWWAAFGALLPLVSEQASYALTEARPYALLLATLSVAVLAYVDLQYGSKHPAATRVLLGLALCGLLLSHVFGSTAAAAFLFAEAVGTISRRKIDGRMWCALLLPLFCCVTYFPLLHQTVGTTLISYESSRASFKAALHAYYYLLLTPASALIKLALVTLLFTPFFPQTNFFAYISRKAQIWALFVALLATPFLLVAVILLRSPLLPFYTRYSLAVVMPGYLVLVGFFAWRSGGNMLLGKILTAGAVLSLIYTFSDVPGGLRALAHQGLFAEPALAASDGGVSKVLPGLPLAIDNALVFMQADYELPPQETSRMVYVADTSEALRITHQNATESIEGMARTFHLRSRVVASRQFLDAHRSFLLLESASHPQPDWFMLDLQQHNAHFQLLQSVIFASNPGHLWLVTLT